MRFLACVVFALLAVYAKSEEVEISERDMQVLLFEDVINSTLNGVLGAIPDPLTIEKLDLVAPETLAGLLEGSFNISNFQLTGVRNIVASKIALSILSLSLTMTVDVSSINLNTNYAADVLVLDLLPLYGGGKANINIEGVTLDIKGAANLTGGISIKNVQVLLHVGGITFDLHGLLNNEDFSALVNTALNDNVAKFLNDNAEVLSSIISPIAETIINAILGSVVKENPQIQETLALYNKRP